MPPTYPLAFALAPSATGAALRDCLPQTLPAPEASGQDCVSLIVSVPNRPGAVHDLLVPLKTLGVSMTRFESRPARNAAALHLPAHADGLRDWGHVYGARLVPAASAATANDGTEIGDSEEDDTEA